MKLNPLLQDGIKANGYLGDHLTKSETKGRATAVTMWACCECGATYDCSDDAEECCPEETSNAEIRCPVCAEIHTDAFEASSCCLWKDLDVSKRESIAKIVESGHDWIDAIERVVN